MQISRNGIQEQADPMLQWATFCLGNETYGIDVMRVQEVLRYTEITPVPGALSYILGIINLRGNVVTVVDTRKRFALSKVALTDETRIVIVEVAGQILGLLVDNVADVIYLHQSEIEKTPNVGNESTQRFFRGVCHKNDRLYILVDLDSMIEFKEDENEMSILDEAS
ncbi:MAG: chemotaxis protein CheW [Pseudomonadota bacterium]